MTAITIRDEDHWHELRAGHVGGSEVSALFDMSPWSTRWQLWMEKAGKLPAEDLSGNKAVQAGRFLEQGIARWAADVWDLPISKVEDYHACDDLDGMGATLDFEVDGNPVEIKYSVMGHGWETEGDEILLAPEHYLLQCQHQMACFGGDYAWLIALVKNEPRRMRVQRNEDIISALKAEVDAFWKSIEDGKEPSPDFTRDTDALTRLLGGLPLRAVELAPDLEAMFEEYRAAAAAEKKAAEDKEAAKGMLLDAARALLEGGNTDDGKLIATCGQSKLTLTNVKPNAGKIVTEEMVGTYVGSRKGYPMVRIT